MPERSFAFPRLLLAVALVEGCVQPGLVPPPPMDPSDYRSSIVHVRSTNMPVTARFERDEEDVAPSTCRTPCRSLLANGRYTFSARVGHETFGRQSIELYDDEVDVTVTPPAVPRLPGLLLTPVGAASAAVGVAGIAVGASLIRPTCAPFAACPPSESSGMVWIGAGVAVFVAGLAMLVTGGATLRASRASVDVRYGARPQRE